MTYVGVCVPEAARVFSAFFITSRFERSGITDGSRHLTASPPPLSKLRLDPAGLDDVLTKALSKDPADRYPRWTDFARALAGQADTPPRSPRRHPQPKPQRRTDPPSQHPQRPHPLPHRRLEKGARDGDG